MAVNNSGFPSAFAARVIAPPRSQAYEPAKPRSGFTYRGRDAKALFEYVDWYVDDGGFPVTDYERIGHRAYALPEAEARAYAQSVTCGDDEAVAVIEYPGGLSRVGVGKERRFPVHFFAGRQVRETAQSLIDAATDDQTFHRGLQGLFRGDFHYLLSGLVRHGRVRLANLAEYLPLAKLLAARNSFSSCATSHFRSIAGGGYLVSSFRELVAKVYDGAGVSQLIDRIPAAIKSGQTPPLLSFAERGEAYVAKVAALFGRVRSYLPRLDALAHFFWETFNKLVAANKRVLAFAERLELAKRQFDEAFFKGAGNKVYEELMGPRGKDLVAQAGPLRDLAIGGALFGSTPFLIGTIYQIVYDILELVYNLLWYAAWGMKGLFSWLFTSTADNPAGLLEPDASVFDLFTFGFSFDDLPGQLSELCQLLVSLAGDALESFLDEAAFYGRVAGEGAAAGALFLGESLVSLLTAGHPGNYNVVDHLVWQMKKWFNVGCLIGPIIVDIALLFCSGGTSGIFTAVTKAAKLGKVGKLKNAFRFSTKMIDWIGDSQLYKKLSSLIPDRLLVLGRQLVAQLWSLTGKASDNLKRLLKAVNDKLPKGPDKMPDDELIAFGARLDNWYDAAGAVELFAGLTYLIVGDKWAKVGPDGKLFSL